MPYGVDEFYEIGALYFFFLFCFAIPAVMRWAYYLLSTENPTQGFLSRSIAYRSYQFIFYPIGPFQWLLPSFSRKLLLML